MTDSELADRCRRGDREAQRLLYDSCSDRIYRMLLRMTRNADDAFDLAQETFIRAFEKIDTFDGASTLTTWVYRIAVNIGVSFLRRRKANERAVLQYDPRQPGSPEIAAQDDRLDVTDAVARLPHIERTLVVLRYYEGLSYEEMAQVLDKPSGTIASGLNRARQMLQEMLQPSARKEQRRTGGT